MADVPPPRSPERLVRAVDRALLSKGSGVKRGRSPVAPALAASSGAPTEPTWNKKKERLYSEADVRRALRIAAAQADLWGIDAVESAYSLARHASVNQPTMERTVRADLRR
jgi:hypothetical protein